jgi:integrase
MLKAALNHAYDEGHVASRDAWGRRLAPFEKVEAARVRYLTVAEAERLINACEPDFRALVRAALETGCRYGELVRWLEVCDFNADASTVAIRQSKTGKPRQVVLTAEGALSSASTPQAARSTSACSPMPTAAPGDRPSRPARSLAVMNGTPLLVVAKNLGHTDTRMVERHYGHLATSFIADAIKAGAPRYRVRDETRVVPLRSSALKPDPPRWGNDAK